MKSPSTIAPPSGVNQASIGRKSDSFPNFGRKSGAHRAQALTALAKLETEIQQGMKELEGMLK